MERWTEGWTEGWNAEYYVTLFFFEKAGNSKVQKSSSNYW